MKKWFKDTDSREVQILPVGLRYYKDGRKGEEIPDDMAKLVMVWHGKNEDGCSYQVLFNTQQTLDNNYYWVLVFAPNDEFVYNFGVNSKTSIPPIWDRRFGLDDYIDYHEVMNKLNLWMEDVYDQAPFPVNKSLENKWVSLLAGTKDEIDTAISENKSYQILTIKAEAFFAQMKLVKIENE